MIQYKDTQETTNCIQPQRSSNLELYRIIVMFMIVCHHYVVNSGLMEVMGGANSLTRTSLFYYIMGAWGKTGINCFVLITGYFMCKSNITLRKFLKLYLQVVFYAVVFYFIFCVAGYQSFSKVDFLKLFLPIRQIASDNFVSSFIVWWLFIPFLNAIVHNITNRQHQLLVGLTISVFTLYNYLPDFEISLNPICWFSTLYFIASYMRLHQDSIPKANSTRFWGIVTIMSIIIGVASIIGIIYIDEAYDKTRSPYWLVSDSNAPLALLISVSGFMFFKNLHIPQSKIINTIASTTFGILLIHANCASMRQWLWKDTVDCVGHYDVEIFYIYAIGSVACIFFLCSAIDFVRMKTIEKNSFRFIDKYLK